MTFRIISICYLLVLIVVLVSGSVCGGPDFPPSEKVTGTPTDDNADSGLLVHVGDARFNCSPIEGASVTAIPVGGGVSKVETTSQYGEVVFSVTQTGIYRITVRKAGYQSKTQDAPVSNGTGYANVCLQPS